MSRMKNYDTLKVYLIGLKVYVALKNSTDFSSETGSQKARELPL